MSFSWCNRSALVVGAMALGLAFAGVLISRFMHRDGIASPRTATVSVGGVRVTAEIAVTPEEHQQGLSGRMSLPAGRGMIFLFATPTRTSFWMRGMEFSIDIIWLREGQVVGITEKLPLPAGTPLPTYSPPVAITAALEVPAGFVQRNGIQVGDWVHIR